MDDDTVVSNLFNVVTIENNDAVKIVGGATLINGNIQTVSADVARVIVESVDGHDVPQITQMDVDVDVVGGNINIGQTEACSMMTNCFPLLQME